MKTSRIRIKDSSPNLIFIMCSIMVFMHSCFAAEESQDLTILRDSYLRALEKAKSPIQETYIKELVKLKLKKTKEGLLEEALTVDKELQSFLENTNRKENTTQIEANVENVTGEWYCNDVETDVYLIKSDKKAFHAGDSGKWEADGKALTIKWKNGFRLVIDIHQSGKTIYGKSYRPDSSRYDLLKLDKKVR